MRIFFTFLSLAVLSLNMHSQTITVFAGNYYYGYSGDGGPATSAKFSTVGGMAFDQAGNMFFSDTRNNVIRKVNTSGIITTVVGTGTVGNSGDGGPAISAELNQPENIVFDAVGNLYIKEPKNGKIRKVDVNGNISTYTTIPVNPLRARAMAIDGSGNLFVNNDNQVTIAKINTAGFSSVYAGIPNTQGGIGDGGPATAAELWQAFYLTTDASGNLYIAEYQANTIRKVDVSGVISTFAGVFLSTSTQGNGGSVGDGGLATSAYLAAAKGMAVNSNGELFVASDYGKIRFINSAGIINTVSTGYDINQPELLAFDSNNNLYVSDGYVIKKITNPQVVSGINESEANKIKFSFYPNPANKIITITVKKPTSPLQLQVTDILGQTVMSASINDSAAELNISNLKSGIYFVTLVSGNSSNTQKLIVE